MNRERIRVFVVDDHPMVRTGLAAMIDGESELQRVGEAATGAEALRLVPAAAPDVVLIDLVMPQMDGIEVTSRLRPQLPGTKFVILTSLVDPGEVDRAIAAGANGYLLKTASAHELVNVIRAAHAGRRTLAPEVTDALIARRQQNTPGNDLTPRERELLELMTRGMNNQEIAAELSIALPTVKFHITNILSKLQADNRTEAVLTALKHKIVPAP
ncbi:MAG: response regulator transcription factor [Burkholderiales bacterium]|nr:response regulator transcription factor [Burkholderiales bacterium]MDE2397198.1 response regulator transcription factor [Burkholderiales bacterium]MDE2456476.1 response regulator transcription factor [Burkholderiales bacterium]